MFVYAASASASKQPVFAVMGKYGCANLVEYINKKKKKKRKEQSHVQRPHARTHAHTHERRGQHFRSELFSAALAGHDGAKHEKTTTAGGSHGRVWSRGLHPASRCKHTFGEVRQEKEKRG